MAVRKRTKQVEKRGGGKGRRGAAGRAHQEPHQKARRQAHRGLHGSQIEDYCLIGDCETAALVSRHGSIDWLCWPDFSSGACFAALLGTRDHGYWSLVPVAKLTAVRRRYVPETLVLETTFETHAGEVCVVDFMPLRARHSHLIRMVRGVRGRVKMRMDLALRFDSGRTVPWVTSSGGELHAVAGDDMVVLRTRAHLHGEGPTTVSEFTVRAGQTVSFTLTNASSLERPPLAPAAEKALRETKRFWTDWAKRNSYRGQYQEQVRRSLITLKALTYRPSGGIVAAATTSLPEQVGGARNWDYRYCWLRDTAFTLLSMMAAGYQEEAITWRRWLLRAIAGSPEQLQSIYGIRGERQIPEWEAYWLPGYRCSRPVRIGNAAAGQFQLDVFGEVAAALARMPEAEDDIRVPAGALQASLVDHLCDVWRQPDKGIWEMRGDAKHFTYSKVMAWVALDRAIRYYEKVDGKGDVARWRKHREMIHREVCAKGFNNQLNSFVQSYGARELDASCLRIALVGFLPPDDPRIRGTVEAIERNLMRGGLVRRYNTRTMDDGLSGGEGTFLACSFWMVSNLWLIGRKRDAVALYEKLLGLCNDVGLLSEEYDPVRRQQLGNFPQALSHISLIHAAFTLSGHWRPQPFEQHRCK